MDHSFFMAKGLHKSMNLWAMLCRATQDKQVILESSDKMWSTGGGKRKPLQYSCLKNTMSIMKSKICTGRWALHVWRWKSGEMPRKNEEVGPKQKPHPVVDTSGGKSKIWCCKDQYCIGTWNVRSENQGKLDVVNRRWQESTSAF